MQYEELSGLLGYGAQWMRNMSSDDPGPRLTDEPSEEEQLDFDELWAEKLKEKYGIDPPFAD